MHCAINIGHSTLDVRRSISSRFQPREELGLLGGFLKPDTRHLKPISLNWRTAYSKDANRIERGLFVSGNPTILEDNHAVCNPGDIEAVGHQNQGGPTFLLKFEQ